jgi:hypothetical protein
MTKEQLLALIEELGLIDLGDAIAYLDPDGAIEALLITEKEPQAACA